jgi:YebC/PmpR family DNA-binding regulatory protein
MSGHSKWKTIKGKKGKTDAARGKVFTKIGKEIAMACKSGDTSVDTNSKLRDSIAKAKANNMPLDNINRAIKKGAGEMDGINYEEIVYEGYGPSGVAILVVALTDNKNRTASSVRCSFDRSGGNMGSTGCVSFMFQRKGQIIIERTDKMDEDEVMMMALDAGAEDFNAEEEVFEIITSPDSFSEVRESLEKSGYEFLSADITMIPENTVALDLEHSEKLQKMIDRFEDDDDVQDVYHNADLHEDFEG